MSIGVTHETRPNIGIIRFHQQLIKGVLMKDGISLNAIELKTLRQKLGIPVKEFSALNDVAVEPRSVRYWESDKRKIPLNISSMIHNMVDEYTNSFKPILTQDVMVWGYEKGEAPTMPSYLEFDDFKQATSCDNVGTWYMYQQAIASLFMEGFVGGLTSNEVIPAEFVIWKVLREEQTCEQVAQDDANKRLKIWYVHQAPCKPYEQFVNSASDARLVLNSIYNLTLSLSDNKIIPDYSNAGGLVIYADADGSGKRDWYEWEDFEARDINDDED